MKEENLKDQNKKVKEKVKNSETCAKSSTRNSSL